jgi:hypothetical protein
MPDPSHFERRAAMVARIPKQHFALRARRDRRPTRQTRADGKSQPPTAREDEDTPNAHGRNPDGFRVGDASGFHMPRAEVSELAQ